MKRHTFVAGLAAMAALVESAAAADAAAPAPDLATHERYMRLAIEQAKRNPVYPFGAVIVDSRSGEVLARGVNSTSANPTFHGEMVALNDYVARHGNRHWERATLYTTGEPCAMCAAAIVWAGIPRVVYASATPFLAPIMDQITIRMAAVVAASPFYRSELLLGGVLAAETDPMFRARPTAPSPP
jgi:tRNA(adenine34) deaminase